MEKNLEHIKFNRKSRNNECVICGSLKNFAFSSLCIECSPFMYKKQGYPHQKVRRTKKWKECRERLLAQKNYQCEWCGSKKQPLSIHHSLRVDSRTYESIWNDILYQTIDEFLKTNPQRKKWFESFINFEKTISKKRSIRYYQEKVEKEQVESCPECDNTNLISRKKSPIYRCSKCNIEFNKPRMRPNNRILKKLERIMIPKENPEELNLKILLNSGYINKTIATKFIGKIMPILYKEIDKKYKKKIETLVSNYMNMEETEVLCKRCHNAHRKGLELCPICKKNFHSPFYDSCYQCHSKEKKIENLLMQKICDLLDTSEFRVLESQMEGDCIKCGNWTFEDPYQYAVYLPDKNSSVGFLCHDCFKEYKKTNENRYIVKIENE